MTEAAPPARRTVLRQAVADMRCPWCPVTANVPTRMTESGFQAACEGFQEKATQRCAPARFQAKKYAACLECMGKYRPKGLEIISIKEFETGDGVQMATVKTKEGTCQVCGREKIQVSMNNLLLSCSRCKALQAVIKKAPETVVAEMTRLHGDKYFPGPAGASADFTGLLKDIKTMFRGLEDDFSDLPGIAADKLIQIGKLEEANTDLAGQNLELESNCGKMANKMKFLQADIEEQASIIKDLTESRLSPALLPEDISETGAAIVMQCDMLKQTLLAKNRAYGDSAINPVRIFSSADPEEQLLVRIDDKLSRLARGVEFPGDDTIADLAGYLVLLMVQRDQGKGKREEEKGLAVIA